VSHAGLFMLWRATPRRLCLMQTSMAGCMHSCDHACTPRMPSSNPDTLPPPPSGCAPDPAAPHSIAPSLGSGLGSSLPSATPPGALAARLDALRGRGGDKGRKSNDSWWAGMGAAGRADQRIFCASTLYARETTLRRRWASV
jgi:hypothetical protein